MFSADAAPAGGAPLLQVVLTALIVLGFLGPTLLMVAAERAGRSTPLGRLADRIAARAKLPRWAGLPSLMLFGSLLSAGIGVYWDVPYHVDLGRDQGPLANPAHYPILFGLLGVFAAGLVSCGLATDQLPRHTVRLWLGRRDATHWRAPLGGVIITVAGDFALLGFPLDDLWHRVFGQDVTEWGPTHVLMIGGAVLATLGGAVLAAEARQVGASARAVRMLEFRSSHGWLLGISVFLMEYEVGVPQFPMVAQVVIIAVAGTWALVWVRSALGPGIALLAVVGYLVTRTVLMVGVGVGLERTTHRFSLFLAQAVLVELLALVVPVRQRYRFGILAGVLVGILGTLSEWAWTQVFLPLPWPAGQLPVYLGYGLLTGVGAGLLAGWQLNRLDRIAAATATLDSARRWEYAPLLTGAVLVLGMLAVSVPRTTDGTVQGEITLDPAGPGTAVVAVRLDDPAAVEGAVWFYTLSWQGGGSVRAAMVPAGDGVWRTDRPVPVAGEWKTLIRLHKPNNYLVAAPVYLPADPAIPVAEVPARSGVTRAFDSELHVLQREAKIGLPVTLWYGGYLTLLLGYLVLFGIIAALHARAAGPACATSPQEIKA